MFMAFRVENLDRKLVLQLQTKLLGHKAGLRQVWFLIVRNI